MDDPGELFRFWLQLRYHERGFRVAKLAASLKVQPGTVGHWLRRRGVIATKYWPAIARFFEREHPELLISEARRLWTNPENRRYYTALSKPSRRQVKKTAAVTDARTPMTYHESV